MCTNICNTLNQALNLGFSAGFTAMSGVLTVCATNLISVPNVCAVVGVTWQSGNLDTIARTFQATIMEDGECSIAKDVMAFSAQKACEMLNQFSNTQCGAYNVNINQALAITCTSLAVFSGLCAAITCSNAFKASKIKAE